MTAEPVLCVVSDRSQVGEARRRAAVLAGHSGLGEVPRERLALVVSELGSNLVKHGGGGELIVRSLGVRSAIEVLALDKGKGMAVEDCFQDGYSTVGSAGTGLGAVRRLASAVDVYSRQPGGTAIVVEVADGRSPAPVPANWQVGAVCVPKPGEEVSGDAWSVVSTSPEAVSVLVADGLGHGLGAADAARAAVRLFEAHAGRNPGSHVSDIHDALRSTRGAAAAVARIDRRTGVVTFAGIGNIAGAIVTGARARQLVSMNGTLGHEVRKINEFTYPWQDDALLVMHSDGLTGRWDLERYPGLVARHPSLVAGVLFRDFHRGRDDATVVAVRVRPTT